MDQREVLDRLRNAKSAHLGWVNRARALIEGNPVDQEKIPVMPTDCIFGKWYYGDGRALSKLTSFRDVEQPHNELHRIYAEIFNILFEQKKGSFLSRMLGGRKREQEKRMQEARDRFHDLQQMSNIIIAKLDKIEKDIRALTPEQQRVMFGG